MARRAAYASGVISAAAAVMSDLEQRGALGDAEILRRDQDGTGSVCSVCELRRLGYAGLADRLEFVIGVTRPGARA
jgi:hypothetical protein